MRKYLSQGEPPKWVVGLLVAFAITVYALLPYSVFGSTIQYPIYIGGTEVDSVQFIYWEDMDGSTMDTIVISTTMNTTYLALDDTKNYFAVYAYWFSGEAEPYCDQIYLPFNYNPAGYGDNNVTVYAIDTTGTDTLLEDVNLTITNTSTGRAYPLETNSSGYNTWRLSDGTYELTGRETNHIFGYDTVTFSSDSTDTIFAYDVSINAVTGTNTCNVYGDVYSIDGQQASYAEITFSLAGDAVDTCSSVFLGSYSITTRANSNGRFQQELIYSNCLEDRKYNMTVKYRDGTTRTTTITVPRQASYQVTE